MNPYRILPIALSAWVIGLMAAQGAEQVVPSWIEADPAAKKATIDIQSSTSSNNGSFNFNGYANGEIRIVVPVGWQIKVKFQNPDINYRHSAVITKPYPPKEIPHSVGRKEVAISRAYTKSPEQGILGGGDFFRFRTTPEMAGAYYLLCGVVGHGSSGMWIHFTVSESAEFPYILIEKEPPVPARQ